MVNKIRKIEIDFPIPVETPAGFELALNALIGMVCKKYESENPKRVMWCAGHGSKPVWNEASEPTLEPSEPTFDDAIYHIGVAEREGHEKELRRRQE